LNVLSGSVAVDGSLVLNVYYVRNELSVSFFDINNELIDTLSVLYGGTVLVPESPSVSGYSFLTWDKSLENITVDKQIYAIYTPNTYQIILDVDGGDALEQSSYNVIYDGEILILVEPTRLGYTFVKWVNENQIEFINGIIYQVAGNTILTAVWAANDATYTVNYYQENIIGSYDLFETIISDGVTDVYVEAIIKSLLSEHT
jgi:hypothetical protein